MLVELYFSIMREFGDKQPRCPDSLFFFFNISFFWERITHNDSVRTWRLHQGEQQEEKGRGFGGLNNTYSLFGIGTSAPGEPAPPTNSCFTFPSCAAVRLSSCQSGTDGRREKEKERKEGGKVTVTPSMRIG